MEIICIGHSKSYNSSISFNTSDCLCIYGLESNSIRKSLVDSNLEHKKQQSYFNTIDSLYLLAVFRINYHGDAINCLSLTGWVLTD